MIRFLLFYCITLVLFTSCSGNKVETIQEYTAWINNPSNGLIKDKEVGDLRISAKFLSPVFLAYQEFKRMKYTTKNTKDSLIKYYAQSHTFLLTIAINEKKTDKRGDLLTNNISSYEEYKNRLLELTFNLGDYIDLQVGSEIYEPVLSNMINDYGLSSKKDFYLVFAKQAKNKEDLFLVNELDLIYYDDIFNTGKSHFVFTKEELQNLPEFNFKK